MGGDLDSAPRVLQASLELWRKLGDHVGIARALSNLATNLFLANDFDQAGGVQNEAVAEARAGGQPFTVSLALNDLGRLSQLQGKYEDAAMVLRESIAAARTVERGSDRAFLLAVALGYLGRALSQQRESSFGGAMVGQRLDWLAATLGAIGEPVRAATLFGAADATWQGRRPRPPSGFRHPFDDVDREGDLHAVQAQLDEQTFAKAWARGRSMTTPEVIAYALGET